MSVLGLAMRMAMHWQYTVRVTERDSPKLNSKMVPATGFEPATLGLKDRCSNQAELRRRIRNCAPSVVRDGAVSPKCCLLAGLRFDFERCGYCLTKGFRIRLDFGPPTWMQVSNTCRSSSS